MPDILRLLKTGGTLVSDNVLRDGDIIESHYAVMPQKPDDLQTDAGIFV